MAEAVNYSVPEIDPEGTPGRDTLEDEINERLRYLNSALADIALILNTVRGLEGNTPTLDNSLDLGGNGITNGRASRSDTDFVIRRELIQLGLFQPNPGRPLETSIPIVAGGGLTVPGGEVVTLDQVLNIVSSIVGGAVATIRDGQTIDQEDLDGTTGGTGGTLLFAASLEDGKLVARPVRINEMGIRHNDPHTHLLLQLILDQLREIKDELRD